MLEVGDNISISIMFMIGCVQSYTSIQTKIIDYQNVTNAYIKFPIDWMKAKLDHSSEMLRK